MQEVMTMPASVQGVGVALPNLAFSVIMRSVQQLPTAPRTPTNPSNGPQSPTPPLADSSHVDVKA